MNDTERNEGFLCDVQCVLVALGSFLNRAAAKGGGEERQSKLQQQMPARGKRLEMTVYISQDCTPNRGYKPASVRKEEPSCVSSKRRDDVVYLRLQLEKGEDKRLSGCVCLGV